MSNLRELEAVIVILNHMERLPERDLILDGTAAWLDRIVADPDPQKPKPAPLGDAWARLKVAREAVREMREEEEPAVGLVLPLRPAV